MSASDILSSAEMHTLLNEKGSRSKDPHQAAADGIPLNFYDFINEYHKSITKTRGFQAANLALANEFRERLYRLTRKKFQVEVIESEATTYEQYLENNNEQSTLNIVKLIPSNAYMLVMVDRQLLFSCIEMLFGGKINNSTRLLRPFGQVDVKLSRLMCDFIQDEIKHCWDTILDIDFEYIKTTTDHLIPNCIKPTDKVIVLQYSIKSDDMISRLDICFPYHILNSANQSITDEDETAMTSEEKIEWLQNLKNNVFNAYINLSAQITETEIKLKDVMNLQVGDVISIDNPNMGILLAEGSKAFKINCGVQEGTKVVEIIERITD